MNDSNTEFNDIEVLEQDVSDDYDTDKEKNKGHSSSTCLAPPKAKKKKYDAKFQNRWLYEDAFKDWLEQKDKIPYCKVCKISLSCARTALNRHKDSSTHMRNKRMLNDLQQSHVSITSLFSAESRPARIEIKLCAFIAENNLPICLAEDLVALLKNLFPNEESLRCVSLGKQKSTNIIRQVLGFYSIKETMATLKSNPFSIIIDETTDRSTKSQLAILGMYFDEESFKLVSCLIDLITLPDGTATTIYESLIKCLNEKDIPMENVIGYCSDTCNVMFGKHHSVAQMLVENYPWILTVKCTCHMIHLCSSYASKKLPKSLEDLCRNIYSHFKLSSKRLDAFVEFQEFLELEKNKILRLVDTRWLSMKGVVKRILEQYDALKLYFTSVVFEDPTHTNETILRSLNNKFNLAYLEFMDFSLGRLTSFNTLFQSETPLLHQLKDEVERLIISFCNDFLKISYVRSTSAFDIDPLDQEQQVPLNQVYTGIASMETVRSIEADLGQNHPDIQLFRTHCRNFLIEVVVQIKERFSDCQNLDHLSCLSPTVAYNLEVSSLSMLYQRMPHLEKVAKLQDVDQEWRDHALGLNLNDRQSPNEYWQRVFNERSPTGRNRRFPNLVKVIKVLLSLPFSNVAAERLFSQLKLIKSDQRTSLKHESLAALLSTKLMATPAQGKLQAVRLEPCKEMLKMHREMKTNATNDEVAELREKFVKSLKSKDR